MTDDRWTRFAAEAQTDDWAELADALGIEYSDDDLNSRAIRKRVFAWAEENDAWDHAWRVVRRLEQP